MKANRKGVIVKYLIGFIMAIIAIILWCSLKMRKNNKGGTQCNPNLRWWDGHRSN